MSASTHSNFYTKLEVTLHDTGVSIASAKAGLATRLYHNPEISCVRFKFLHLSGNLQKGCETSYDLEHGCRATVVELDVPTSIPSSCNYYDQVAEQMFRCVFDQLEFAKPVCLH